MLTSVPNVAPELPEKHLGLTRWDNRPCDAFTDDEAQKMGVGTRAVKARGTVGEVCVREGDNGAGTLRYTFHLDADLFSVKYPLAHRWRYFAEAAVMEFPAVALSKETVPTTKCVVFVGGAAKQTLEVELTTGGAETPGNICDRVLAIANTIVTRIQA